MKNALIMESLGTFFTKDMPVEHLMEVLHDIIADSSFLFSTTLSIKDSSKKGHCKMPDFSA